MIDPMFQRNLKEAQRLSRKHIAIVGCGSLGSAFADIAARSGLARLTLVDPDCVAVENLARHVLSRRDLGKSKAEALKSAIEGLNPNANVTAVRGKFEDFAEKPDLVISLTDSFFCQSKVNDYALRNGVSALFGGCWGEATLGELFFLLPGRTACFECYAGFRRDEVEIPHDPRRYTDPALDSDPTKLPGQAGLWGNILIIAGFLFQVALGLLDPENERAQLIDCERPLLVVNVTAYDSPVFQYLGMHQVRVQRGCTICDETKLGELGKDLAIDAIDPCNSPTKNNDTSPVSQGR